MRLRTLLLEFTLALTILTCLARGQVQGESHRKWLECDVDWVFSEEEVGPDFSLKLSFHGYPVEGSRIELGREGKAVATARTNARGLAHFSATAPGEYHPRAADGLVFPLGSLVIKVVPNHGPDETVKLEWPSQSISVRALSGRLTTSENLDDLAAPLQNAKVELLELRTGRLIESSQTDIDGSYDFVETKRGLYALRVTPAAQLGPNKPQSAAIAVELDAAGDEGMIPVMRLLQSDCSGVQLYRKMDPGDWEQQ